MATKTGYSLPVSVCKLWMTACILSAISSLITLIFLWFCKKSVSERAKISQMLFIMLKGLACLDLISALSQKYPKSWCSEGHKAKACCSHGLSYPWLVTCLSLHPSSRSRVSANRTLAAASSGEIASRPAPSYPIAFSQNFRIGSVWQSWEVLSRTLWVSTVKPA